MDRQYPEKQAENGRVVFTVIGNRPQFIKAAAVSGPLRAVAQEVLVHTGQHYDDELSQVFFEELDVPRPERELGAGTGSNTAQTARILAALEPVLAELEPQLALVYGDTNSTLAGALAAAQAGIPVGHVEAGMRSFDRTMPEELNRVLTDHASDLLLCSTPTAVANLEREGAAGEAHLVGDVMADVSLAFRDIAAKRSTILADLGLEAGSYLAVLVCLLLMRPGELHRRPPEPRARGAVREGLRYLRSVPTLWISFAMLAAIGTLSYNFGVTLPLFVTRALHSSEGTFTVLYSVFSLGAVVASLVVARRGLVRLRHIILGARAA